MASLSRGSALTLSIRVIKRASFRIGSMQKVLNPLMQRFSVAANKRKLSVSIMLVRCSKGHVKQIEFLLNNNVYSQKMSAFHDMSVMVNTIHYFGVCS